MGQNSVRPLPAADSTLRVNSDGKSAQDLRDRELAIDRFDLVALMNGDTNRALAPILDGYMPLAEQAYSRYYTSASSSLVEAIERSAVRLNAFKRELLEIASKLPELNPQHVENTFKRNLAGVRAGMFVHVSAIQNAIVNEPGGPRMMTERDKVLERALHLFIQVRYELDDLVKNVRRFIKQIAELGTMRRTHTALLRSTPLVPGVAETVMAYMYKTGPRPTGVLPDVPDNIRKRRQQQDSAVTRPRKRKRVRSRR